MRDRYLLGNDLAPFDIVAQPTDEERARAVGEIVARSILTLVPGEALNVEVNEGPDGRVVWMVTVSTKCR